MAGKPNLELRLGTGASRASSLAAGLAMAPEQQIPCSWPVKKKPAWRIAIALSLNARMIASISASLCGRQETRKSLANVDTLVTHVEIEQAGKSLGRGKAEIEETSETLDAGRNALLLDELVELRTSSVVRSFSRSCSAGPCSLRCCNTAFIAATASG